MKRYYRIIYTIRDSEYEYLQYTLSTAENEQEAIEKAREEAEEWTKDDYRQCDDFQAREMTRDQYDIIKNYIY